MRVGCVSGLTWQMCELIEELVFHAGELMVGVVRGGLRRRGFPLFLPLFLGRPAEPRPCHADQSHHFPDGAGGKRDDKCKTSHSTQHTQHRSGQTHGL